VLEFRVRYRRVGQFPPAADASGFANRATTCFFALVTVAFGLDCLCLVESGGKALRRDATTGEIIRQLRDDDAPDVIMRCVDYADDEMWRFEAPKRTMVTILSYRKADRSFYGVEWDCLLGDWSYLVRYSATGEREKICPLQSAAAVFCRNGNILVTSKGQVINVADGTSIRRLRFPKRRSD
jgi:hypothetical protein